MFAGYWGFVGGGMLFFSQYWGARDHDGITRSYGMTLLFMMTVGVLFACLAIFAPEFVMGVYTDKPEIQKIGISYLRIVGFAYPLQVIAMAASALLRSIEQVKIPLYGGIASVVANCFFNYLFIFGKFLVFRKWVQPGAARRNCYGGYRKCPDSGHLHSV